MRAPHIDGASFPIACRCDAVRFLVPFGTNEKEEEKPN